jgi:hypothetical protein
LSFYWKGLLVNRLDVYTAVHKMHRARLCGLIVDAGTTDPGDATARTRLAAAVRAAIAELHAHAQHEDRFIHPLLREKAPQVAATLDAEHIELDTHLDELVVVADDYADPRPANSSDPNTLYRALAGFAASYFAHIAVEETEALPALWKACSDEELAGILTSFKASRSPIEALTSLLAQLPTLNPREIAHMVNVAVDSNLRTKLGDVLATVLTPTQLGTLSGTVDLTGGRFG